MDDKEMDMNIMDLVDETRIDLIINGHLSSVNAETK